MDSPCITLSSARPGMWLFHRFHPHNDLYKASVFNAIFHKTSLEEIILRITNEIGGWQYQRGYYDISFFPDGVYKSGGHTVCQQSIYPVTQKYIAIYEFEQEWQLNEQIRIQIP